MLTQEELLKLVIMDESGDLIWRRRKDISWQNKRFNKQYAGSKLGTLHHTGYYICRAGGFQFRLHRLVWLYVNGSLPKSLDHIDQNKTNNKISNLREATTHTNGLNRSMNKNNKSGVMGVFFCDSRNKWKAQVKFNMKQITIGYFYSFFDAVCARKSKENELGFHSNHGNRKINGFT